MIDSDKVTQLARLLGAVARDHHDHHGAGPAPHWAEWYAARLQPEIGAFVGYEPTVEEITGWLRDADAKYKAESPETRWPYFYAGLILDSPAFTDRPS